MHAGCGCALSWVGCAFRLFIESICDDPKVLEANLQHKVNCSPDFVGVEPAKAKLEFLARIHKYEQVYKTITGCYPTFMQLPALSSGHQASELLVCLHMLVCAPRVFAGVLIRSGRLLSSREDVCSLQRAMLGAV